MSIVDALLLSKSSLNHALNEFKYNNQAQLSTLVKIEYRVLRVELAEKNGQLPALLKLLYYLDNQQIKGNKTKLNYARKQQMKGPQSMLSLTTHASATLFPHACEIYSCIESTILITNPYLSSWL